MLRRTCCPEKQVLRGKSGAGGAQRRPTLNLRLRMEGMTATKVRKQGLKESKWL
jgi:hypothetical protein